jgi:predicted regulator of Ras-like GTPase activity (Roadblock/LC7/MglB family)
MVFNSPKQTLSKTINKMVKGQGNQKQVESLTKIIDENPELIEIATNQLIEIIHSEKKRISSFVFDALLNIAERDPEPLGNASVDIIKIIRTSEEKLDIKNTLKALDILSILTISHPKRMRPAIPVLFNKIHHSNSNIRSASFFILDMIAKSQPESFLNHTPDLVKCLHGLNNDERVYGIRLINKIVADYPDIFDEFYSSLYVLAYNYPSTEVRSEAYEIFQRFKLHEKKAEVELHEFEKDLIGLDDFHSEEADFEMVVDELSERIEGIDFESSAADLIKSLGMGHLIVKPEYMDTEVEETKIEQEPQEQVPLEKLPPKPETDEKTPEIELQRIEYMMVDPIIRAQMSFLRDVSEESTEQLDSNTNDPKVESIAQEPIDEDFEKLSEMSKEMVQLIISEMSKEDWILNVGVTTKKGTIIAAHDPDSLDDYIRKRIYDMLSYEGLEKHGFMNRVTIELSDKQLMGILIDSNYVLFVFTKTNIQFGMVLYEITKTAIKIRELIKE